MGKVFETVKKIFGAAPSFRISEISEKTGGACGVGGP
jgi:hypothetical protein